MITERRRLAEGSTPTQPELEVKIGQREARVCHDAHPAGY